MAQPFDPDALRLSGEALPIGETVRQTPKKEAIFSVSDTGRLLYQTGHETEESRLVWLDREGQERGTVGAPAHYVSPALSHDETRIAVPIRDAQTQKGDIWILDVERGTRTRLTFNPASDWGPLWSPDDQTIYFTSNRSSRGQKIYAKSSFGTGETELVYGGERGAGTLSSLSPNGTTGWYYAFSTTTGTGQDIYRLDLKRREAEGFLQTPYTETAPKISPNGRWLLYQSDESGRLEVYVRSLGDDGGKWQISTDGGAIGKWTRDGREIVFQAPDGTLLAVGVALEPTFSVEIPEALFNPGTARWLRYDVTPDGNRFLVAQPLERPVSEPLTLVLNWTSELER